MIRTWRAILGGVLLLALAGGTQAAPLEEAIIPLEQYTSDKARALATTYHVQLRQIYENVSHCLPWLDIGKHGLGFRTPRGAQGDDRYLSIWVWVEQQSNPGFAALPPARRASAMVSRYGVDLLRRLSSHPQLVAEPRLAGYSVVLTWLKPDGRSGSQPVSETLAVFVDKTTLQGFFAQTVTPAEFVKRAIVAIFDGQTALGRLPLEIWEDRFVSTYKPKGYTPNPSYRC